MFSAFGGTVVASIILFFGYYSHAHAQTISPDAVARINELLLTSIEAGDAINEISDTANLVSDAVRYAQQAENHEKPLKADADWDKVISHYKAAAEVIRSEPLATAITDSDFQVTWKDFLGCHTRNSALSDLESFSKALGAAAERGNAAAAKYQKLTADLLTIIAGANKMIEVLVPLTISDPGATAHVFKLLNGVLPAVSELLEISRKKQAEVDKSLPIVRMRKENLDGNISQLRATECSLAGSWAGTITVEGLTQPMTVDIRGEPGRYSVSYSIAGKPNSTPCILSINAKERRLDFRPSCSPPANSLRFSLNFSESFTSLAGRETDEGDAEASFPIVMQRK